MNTIRKTDENKELASNLVDLRKVEKYKKEIKNIFIVKDADKIGRVKKGVKRFIDLEYEKQSLTAEEYAILLKYLNILEKKNDRKLKEKMIEQDKNDSGEKEKKADLSNQEVMTKALSAYKIAIENCFIWEDVSKVKMAKDATIKVLEKDYASHKLEKQEYDMLLKYLQSLNQKYEKSMEEEKLPSKQRERIFKEGLKCTTEKKELQFIPMIGREGWGKDIFRDQRESEEK